MIVEYTYTDGSDPIYINNSNGVQRVLILFKDDGRTFVYYCDDYYRTVHLNEIIDRSSKLGFHLDNFKKIESDIEFYYYVDWISRNYNYSGEHIYEKITGHDQGGAVVDTRGF